ncbi:MAG: serine hydrolase [Acidobacteria bacterium]|nr:serine hydrolase [Acidobacteriota bacterium]
MHKTLSLLFLLLALPHTLAAQNRLTEAKAEIEKLILMSGAEKVGVAVYDTDNKQTLMLNEREVFHAASTMKLPVMMELFRRASDKRLLLTERLEVKNKFYSIIDGSEYSLDRRDDSDEEVYRRLGQPMTILELTEHMITMSSNLATNLLIEKAQPEKVMELLAKLGINDTKVLRGVEDQKAFNAGKNNVTTAYDLMLMLKAIHERKVGNGKACEKMIQILGGQRFNDGIPAGLPRDATVAHKTGSITKHNHDAALVMPALRKPYLIVVLTRGIADEKKSDKLIANISRVVYVALAP